MRWLQADPNRPSPFSRATKPERELLETSFGELWMLIVETENDDEELWAYGKLRALFLDNVVHDDQAWFEAMAWAAERWIEVPDPSS